jgi:hypothetical protein
MAALGDEEYKLLWADLGGKDAAEAYRAMWKLVNAPPQPTVRFLADHLRPVSRPDSPLQERIDRLVRELDSDEFTIRRQARTKLEEAGEVAKPLILAALANDPTAEVRGSLERVLEDLEARDYSREEVRYLRALEVLAHTGTSESERVLEALAGGAPEARLTQESKSTLQYVRQRREARESKEKRTQLVFP